MSWTDIAALISAIAFAVLVIFLAYPLFQLGKTFKRAGQSVEQLTVSADQTVRETTLAVQSANTQIQKLDSVTSSASHAAQDVSALTALLSASVGSPLIKLNAFSSAAQSLFRRQVGVSDVRSSYHRRVDEMRSALATETETELN